MTQKNDLKKQAHKLESFACTCHFNMIIPVRCFSCAKTLADKYDWYVAESAKLRAEVVAKDSVSTKGSKEGERDVVTRASHFDPVYTGVLLDKLGLKRYCCRRHMLGQVDMMETI